MVDSGVVDELNSSRVRYADDVVAVVMLGRRRGERERERIQWRDRGKMQDCGMAMAK